MSACPACHSLQTVLVSEHYETQVRLPEADPQGAAPFAPPLRRSILSGTLCITLLWMGILSPGFVDPKRAFTVALTFGLAALAALVAWLRARKSDNRRLAAYRASRACLNCGHRFGSPSK